MVTAVARGRMQRPDEEDDYKMVFRDRVFATQQYIPWFIGSLKLGDKVNLDRVRRDQVKMLEGHNGDKSIGRITRVRHDRNAECFRADAEIPKIDANKDARERIANDLMRDMSVGAALNWEAITLDNADDEWESLDDARWTAQEWELVEISMTPIPRDGKSGLDRAAVLDVLRTGDDIVVFGAENAIMLGETEAKHRPRFEAMVNQQRRKGEMTTQTSAADLLAQARMEAREKREAEKEQDSLTRALAALELEAGEQRDTISALETDLRTAREQLEATAAETLELRNMPTVIAQLEEKVKASEERAETEREAREAEEKRNMEYRAKLDGLQWRPQGPVLQLTNWKPTDRLLSIGNIVKLTWRNGAAPDSPMIDPTKVTLEESFLEVRESELAKGPQHPVSANTVAQVPFSALAERERQIELQRAAVTVASGQGVRPLEITVLGDAGLVLSRYAPIMARMDVRMGVVGAQRLSYLTAQPTPDFVAENADLTAETWTVAGTDKTPHTIPQAFQMSTALRAIDDGTFESIVRGSVFMVLNNAVLGAILVDDGTTAGAFTGIWATANLPNINYGAAQTNFGREDVLAVLNSVRLANTDGAAPIMIASKGLWELMERTPRGLAGTAASGYTNVEEFLLENVMNTNMGVMGMSEGAEVFYYSGLDIASINDPGLVMKPDRCVVWFWGDGLSLEYVPTTNAGYFYRMTAEVNYDVELIASNFARIKRN